MCWPAFLVIAPLAAAVPAWVWATLVMAGFVVVSALTMWLARFAVERKPPSAGRSDDAAAED
jgi:hypothetical protein